MLLNLSDKKVLYAKGAYNKVYPASITKIMTAMLALKYGNMDDTVTISQENVTLESGSQVAGFQAGDQVTMDQLLHCLLVYYANDAASAIAEHIGGSTDKFVEMMNSFAAELGCTGTHFTNPHGLQDENHYTTPYDIYLMLKGNDILAPEHQLTGFHTKNKKADLFEILFRRSAFLFFFLHSVNFYCIIGAITAGIFGLTAIKIRIRSTTVIIVIDHFT